MFSYPVFIAAQHEDGARENFNLTIAAASPEDAMEQAYAQYLPRYGGDDGWRLVVVVDELMATDDGQT